MTKISVKMNERLEVLMYISAVFLVSAPADVTIHVKLTDPCVKLFTECLNSEVLKVRFHD